MCLSLNRIPIWPPTVPAITCLAAVLLVSTLLPTNVVGQVEMLGRLIYQANRPAAERPMTEIRSFASSANATDQPISFRTWEMAPAGWFRFTGSAGRYTMLFTEPGHFIRPVMLTNISVRDGMRLDGLRPEPHFDYANFSSLEWDTRRATRYWQPFVARGTSVTQVGFQLATDGVDGAGPLGQEVSVSIHRANGDDPPLWSQIGPTMVALNVDCGGPKSYHYSVGWNSGEVPLVVGDRYAVRLQTADPSIGLQSFWSQVDEGNSPCFRQDDAGITSPDKQLWMSLASDSDGLCLPVNKRIHKRFGEFAGMARKWTQTYVAQGEGLAAVVCYAAVSGAQPPLTRQRVQVTVRRGGIDGPRVGDPRLGIGEGHYTGDASWGVFAAVFPPGAIRLEAGTTYAIEMESIENEHTVGQFVNIKGQTSDGRGAFNPYRKHPRDELPNGTAYRDGSDPMPFDLDMQIVEYLHDVADWHEQVTDVHPVPVDKWQPFGNGHDTAAPTDEPQLALTLATRDNHDLLGGYVQRIANLKRTETYRLTGRLRCTWSLDPDHLCRIGWDPTGQTDSSVAETIEWLAQVSRHGEWISFTSPPLRPDVDAITIWFAGKSRSEPIFPFRAEVTGLEIGRFRTDIPTNMAQ